MNVDRDVGWLLVVAFTACSSNGTSRPSGGTPPDATPAGEAGGAAGTLYVIDSGQFGPLFAYPAGASGTPAPLYTIAGPYLEFPRGPALDGTGNLYVTGDQLGVSVFARQAQSPTSTVTSAALLGSSASLKGLAVDAMGTLYVLGQVIVNGSQTAGVAVFAPGAGMNAPALRTFTHTMFTAPNLSAEAIAVDRSGDVFVSVQSITSSGSGSILEFAPDANGSAAAARTISGASTLLSVGCLRGLAVDASGAIYVAASQDNLGSRILVFASSTQSGDQAPVRELVGDQTGLANPWSLAFGPADASLYVGNTASDTVTVYPPQANGNEAPLRTIFTTWSGDMTNPVQPVGVAVGL